MAISPSKTWTMTSANASAAAALRLLCFHCGEEVAAGVTLSAAIDGEQRPMCCPGCQAVAAHITASGLDNFYRQRTAYSERPAGPGPQNGQYLVYDNPALAASFCEPAGQTDVTARLLLGGISCAACTWLIEQTLKRQPGVQSALVNLQQTRLDIRFDSRQVRLSEIFSRLDALGYPAKPFQASTRRQQIAQDYRLQLRRLAVAGLGMMQVGMFAIALHAGDIQGIESQYQDLLRWVSLLVASFVVVFSARPFFSTAWRHLRHGAL
jgi:Cu2+-exporting ATPase